MDAQEIMKQLQDPFPPEDIEWRVGSTSGDKSKGIALAYVTNRAIMNRLDSLFGPFGWKNEFREWKGTSQLCGISINFNGEWITKWDGADDSQTEAVKGGLSDAMKRAGYQWGIGRYLYNLENQWVPIKQQGRSYVLVQEPQLPKWALPEGYDLKGYKSPKMHIEHNDSPSDSPGNGEAPHVPTETVTYVKLAHEGQVKMLYAKFKATGLADLQQASQFLGYTIAKFAEVPATDVTKLAQWLDKQKAS